MKKNFNKNTKKGFTLIELLVVLGILGILVAILIPRFSGFTDNAREKAVKADAKNIYTVCEAYYSENGKYPKIGIYTNNKNNTNSSQSDLNLSQINDLQKLLKSTKGKLDITNLDNKLFTYKRYNYTATVNKVGEVQIKKDDVKSKES